MFYPNLEYILDCLFLTSHKTQVIQKYICNVILGKGYDQRQLKKESSVTIYIHQEAELMLHGYPLGLHFLVSELDRIIMFPSCGFADGIQLYNAACSPKSRLLYLLLV